MLDDVEAGEAALVFRNEDRLEAALAIAWDLERLFVMTCLAHKIPDTLAEFRETDPY